MNVVLQFGDVEIKNIVGYKISVGFQPNSGFQGAFYIYAEQKLETRKNELVEVNLGSTDEAPRNTLTFTSKHINYSFDNIDLKEIRTSINHGSKSRILEFRYDPNVSDSQDDPSPNIELNNTEEDNLDGALKKNMKISVAGGTAEEPFAFHLFQQPDVAPIFRFSHRRNKDNSWLEKIIDANNKRVQKDGEFEAFDVNLGSETLSLNAKEVSAILIDESYGTMLDHSLASIEEISKQGITSIIEHSRLELSEDTPRELVEMYISKNFESATLSSMTVETATVIFKPGLYNQIKIV